MCIVLTRLFLSFLPPLPGPTYTIISAFPECFLQILTRAVWWGTHLVAAVMAQC